jgi:amino acid transporter
VVGAGIFRAPQLVAANAAGGAEFVALWVAGGLVSLVGALCYAELASAYPNAGGEYHFLTRAFGRTVGFLCAWSRLTVLQTGSIAILAFVFADYAAPLVGAPESAGPALAAGTVVALTALNVLGLQHGRGTQYLLTAVEVVGLIAVTVAGFVAGGAGASAESVAPGVSGGGNVGLAMVFVLLTFGGWSEAAYLSAELRDGQRGASRALAWGIGVITVLYALANMAYYNALGLAGIAASSAVAADVMRAAAGPVGAAAVSFIVMASALSSANATMITGARSNYALGCDFTLFGFLASWRDEGSTPARALVVQGTIALALVAFGAVARGGFEAMVAYTAPVFWLTLFLAGVAVIALRRRDPEVERPFRVPLYPVLPLLFCATSAYMLYSSVAYAGRGALLGLGVMLAGLPLVMLAGARPAPERRPGEPLRPMPRELKP